MHEELLIGLAGIIGLGIAAQWLAWRLNFPSILLLLLFGFVAGPITLFLHVDELFGDLLFPVVSVSVAIILFEGGLTLRFGDLRNIRSLLPRLLTVGVIITWLLTTAAAYFVVGLELTLSLLLGAILVVTGPTVVIPLLKQIRPTGRVATILRWEGIVIDPVGAVLAVLVFEVIRAADINAGVAQAIVSLLITIVIGLIIGYVTARAMIELFGRNWVPENLQNPVALMFLVAMFTLSNMIQAESGLLTVTVMGIVMANQDLTLHLGGWFKWSLAGKYR
ncbi:MAG: cation:proton antiporter, partial [Anaerolineae bacterium]|nr:cation:proton antiporter [Anaerolineae bacterium]